MTIVAANGIDLAYDSFGDEQRDAILLISGLGTQMIRWTVPFCEGLAGRGYRVLRFDTAMPGFPAISDTIRRRISAGWRRR